MHISKLSNCTQLFQRNCIGLLTVEGIHIHNIDLDNGYSIYHSEPLFLLNLY